MPEILIELKKLERRKSLVAFFMFLLAFFTVPTTTISVTLLALNWGFSSIAEAFGKAYDKIATLNVKILKSLPIFKQLGHHLHDLDAQILPLHKSLNDEMDFGPKK
jgi:hypothetical protein